MINGFIAKKIGSTSVFTPEGKRIAVTKLLANDLVVTQVKTQDKDKYTAVQVAYGSKKTLDKAVKAKLAKLKLDIVPAAFKEFKLTGEETPVVGDKIDAAKVLTVGTEVSVTGTSKGRGFAGVIKRYGFQRQPVSGGQSDRVRAPGAIGAQTPGKVVKGKRMPGHYGNKSRTVSGAKIYAVNAETHEVLVTGSVPGSKKSWVVINL